MTVITTPSDLSSSLYPSQDSLSSSITTSLFLRSVHSLKASVKFQALFIVHLCCVQTKSNYNLHYLCFSRIPRFLIARNLVHCISARAWNRIALFDFGLQCPCTIFKQPGNDPSRRRAYRSTYARGPLVEKKLSIIAGLLLKIYVSHCRIFNNFYDYTFGANALSENLQKILLYSFPENCFMLRATGKNS